MGAKQSKDSRRTRLSFSRRSPSSSSPTHSQAGTSNASGNMRNLPRQCIRNGDNFKSLDQVKQALAKSGLESSNLIVGIDFTRSNEWTGKNSFNGKCLHYVGGQGLNPYEQAISIIGETLSAFDEDNLIPCFGFGDVSTHDDTVFSFYPDNSPCFGFHEALSRYREIVPHVRLAGPTSFAPMIETAISIVDQSGGQYHVLIIADGQVTRSVDTSPGKFSPQEQSTVDAIVKASAYPLSIIVVGVGDGPWDVMQNFDDNIPARTFDNIQFVNFTKIMSSDLSHSQKEANFALAALMEIPLQYRATIEHDLLGNRRDDTGKAPLPPPLPPQNIIPSCPPSPSPMTCPVCFQNTTNLALGCGHQTCHDCGTDLIWCPICHEAVTTRRIRLVDNL